MALAERIRRDLLTGVAIYAPLAVGALLIAWAFAVERYRPPTGMSDKPVETVVYQLIEVKLPAWVGVVAFVTLPRLQRRLLRRAGHWSKQSQLWWVVLGNVLLSTLPAYVLWQLMHPWV